MMMVPQTVKSSLSAGELDVLRAMAGGMKNHEIAFHLNIEEMTVGLRLRTAYVKLCVQNKIEAMCAVLEGTLD